MARDARVDEVRSFNRTVTEHIGVLDDRYMARARSVGLCRLIWEIGERGAEVRQLRARLRLDSGYLSRQLRALEEEGLVETVASPGDGRVRRARLTRAGRKELAELDRRSDDMVEHTLAPLTERQRDRLVAAMTEVRSLLTASAVRIQPMDPAATASRTAVTAYFDELALRFEGGFDAAATLPTGDERFRRPAGVFLVASLHGEVVGCVGIRTDRGQPAEIKRMWVASRVRGLGLGRRLLAAAEEEARRAGAATVRLETNRALGEAIQMYRSSGYQEVSAFNDEPYAHHWLEKTLAEGSATG